MIVKLTSAGLKPINESLTEASDNSDVFIWDGKSEVPKDVVNVKIQDGVKDIGTSSFYFHTSLTNIIIPDSVTNIGEFAFSNCSSLTSVTIPDSVTFIGESAFQNCTSLTSVTIPNSVTSIGWGAFSNCSSLTSVTIPDSITSIGVDAFRNCDSLASVIIPNSVTRIGSYAFYNCKNLENIKLPKNVKLGKHVFKGCDKLKNLSNTINTDDSNDNDIVKMFIAKCLHTKVNNIVELNLSSDDETVDDVDLFDDWFLYNCNPKNVSIPDDIDEITMELNLDLGSYKNIKFARVIFYSDTASYLFFKNYDDANKFINVMTEEFGKSSNSDFEFYATSDDIILSDNIAGLAISDDF